MSLADRVVVMDVGRVIAAGPPEIIRTDPAVVEAYLGGSIEAIERSDARTTETKPATSTRKRVPA
jgi:branched-chain amino acid transport system ATP-binding protein